eukprot:1990578-Karenia_brevis.AAC.1
MFIDVKKAHINPVCDEDVYLSLAGEYHCPEGMCVTLRYWMYGMRQAASAWQKHYATKLGEVGFKRGTSCGV